MNPHDYLLENLVADDVKLEGAQDAGSGVEATCVDASGRDLTEGKTYVVHHVDGEGEIVEAVDDRGVVQLFLAERFKARTGLHGMPPEKLLQLFSLVLPANVSRDEFFNDIHDWLCHVGP